MKKKLQYFFYVLFAAISTLINLGIQKGMEIVFAKIIKWKFYLSKIPLELSFFNGKIYFNHNYTFGLILQMGTATIIAFIFKYVVDKLVIFKDKTSYVSKAHMKQVFLYGSFAVITTIIFWSMELLFKYLFKFPNAIYVGAVVGLAIGYSLKFLLDRKYVFTNTENIK